MNTLVASPKTVAQPTTSFWSRLLQDDSMRALDHLEQLVTGCEIIAALDELELLAEVAA